MHACGYWHSLRLGNSFWLQPFTKQMVIAFNPRVRQHGGGKCKCKGSTWNCYQLSLNICQDREWIHVPRLQTPIVDAWCTSWIESGRVVGSFIYHLLFRSIFLPVLPYEAKWFTQLTQDILADQCEPALGIYGRETSLWGHQSRSHTVRVHINCC